jgi:tripartite-type tricarboxylate transporter receptor subunit TctC
MPHRSSVLSRVSAKVGVLLGVLALLPLMAGASGAQTYPSRAIRLIVPYSAGGASDASARQIAARLEKVLGQSVVVENMPTAAGVVAFGTAAKAAPDGYTLLYGQTSLITTKALRKDVPYDPLTDFIPIAALFDIQSAMIVRTELPVKTLMELVELARKQKGQLTYASLGNGSEPHLITEMFKVAAQVDIQPIPFKTTPTIYTDMIANRIDMMLALMPSSLPQIRADKVRALGVSGAQRSPALPDMPTIREAGIPFAQTSWSGLMAPRGTPADVLDKLHTAAQKALEDPELNAWALNAGAETRAGTSAEFAAFVREQSTVWTKLITDLRLKAE